MWKTIFLNTLKIDQLTIKKMKGAIESKWR
jgi:hypothetical protein